MAYLVRRRFAHITIGLTDLETLVGPEAGANGQA
jgi:hypothetical protein